jgi:hypothetical protein
VLTPGIEKRIKANEMLAWVEETDAFLVSKASGSKNDSFSLGTEVFEELENF